MDTEDLPHLVIRACMQVHATLGPGLTREAYKECLAVELRDLELPVERDRPLSFDYRGHHITCAAQLDFVVDEALILRVLAVDEVGPMERPAMETWLRLSGLRTGLIVNFQVPVMRKGIQKMTLKRREAEP